VIVVINVFLDNLLSQKSKKLNTFLVLARKLNLLVGDIQEVVSLQDIGIAVNQVAHGLVMLVQEMRLDNAM
jgi:hypothetical protein